jgi:hypothetical protein
LVLGFLLLLFFLKSKSEHTTKPGNIMSARKQKKNEERGCKKKPELLMAQQNCPTRTVDTELTIFFFETKGGGRDSPPLYSKKGF